MIKRLLQRFGFVQEEHFMERLIRWQFDGPIGRGWEIASMRESEGERSNIRYRVTLFGGSVAPRSAVASVRLIHRLGINKAMMLTIDRALSALDQNRNDWEEQ